MIYMFIAQGFEETEALATLDILRRCGLEVTTVGIGSQDITGSHNITVLCDTADCLIESFEDMSAVVLPGGMPGTLNLEKSKLVLSALDYAAENDKLICAICAAPSILGHHGLLEGKRAICFPGYESQLGNAVYTDKPAVIDGNIITAKGMGCSIDFAYAIAKKLLNNDKPDAVLRSIQYRL